MYYFLSIVESFRLTSITQYMCKKRWWGYATPVVRRWIVLCLYSFALTRMSFRDFPLGHDMNGGSVKISLSCDWFCMRCHLLISNVLKLGKPGWYCLTKGNILVRASLFFCLSDAFDFREVFLYNTSWVFSIQKAFLKVFHILLNCEEFFLRSLNASPLIKPFVTPGGWHE